MSLVATSHDSDIVDWQTK